MINALWHYGPMIGFGLIKVVMVLTFVLTITPLLTWMERRQSAMMQDRVGPNRANIPLPMPGGGTLNLTVFGLLHAVADGIKMLTKEDFVPRKAEKFFFNLAPFLTVFTTFVLFAVIPMSGPFMAYLGERTFSVPLTVVQLNSGLLFLFALAPLTVYGVFFAGWSSNNRWALLGAVRASAQMLSYDVAIMGSLLGLVIIFGTYDLNQLAVLQNKPLLYLNAAQTVYIPRWGLFIQPLAAVLFFVAALAETKRSPFDMPEGESEIVAGYFIEYSGMKFASFMTAEFVKIILLGAMMTTLFFGGWTIPGASILPAGHMVSGAVHAGPMLQMVMPWGLALRVPALGFVGPENLLALLGHLKFATITFLFCFFQLLVRWTLPRFRYDQLMGLGWKMLFPLALGNTLVTAVLITLRRAG